MKYWKEVNTILRPKEELKNERKRQVGRKSTGCYAPGL
jgi:hypothetical protein